MAPGLLPFHLVGNFAPVKEETTATELAVRGVIPEQLQGRYLRTGPNPSSGVSPHWFLGDGMIHGVELSGGRVGWYRNRYVKTRMLEDPGARIVDSVGNVDRTLSQANTNVVGHGGRIYALYEPSFPTLMTKDLETVGIFDFEGKLKTAMTAHPKLCPVTGEMHFFGYGFGPPLFTYHRVDAHGALVQSEEVDVAGPTMHHDFGITRRHVLIMDLPVVFDFEMALAGTMPYRWSDEYPARLGVMPRDQPGAKARWFDIDPCYVFHPMNAYEDGERIVWDVVRYDDMWRRDPADFARGRLHRWTLDLAAGTVKEEPRDDAAIEFPRVDPRLEGLRHRYGYAVAVAGGASEAPNALIKYDLEDAAQTVHRFGDGRHPGEGVFVPAGPDAGEDEGFVMTFVYDEARDRSDFVILDAQRFDDEPVAVVELPARVPYGFHGNWVAD